MSSPIDIIIPVYNAPECVQPCLDSVLRNSDHAYRIVVIDDGSDQYTKTLIKRYAVSNVNLQVITNENNLGFVKSCNRAIRQSDSEYLVLLNSDTVVPPGWLGRLKQCLDSDPGIGIANPLSNEAANLSIPIAPGCNFLGQDEGLRDRNAGYPEIVTAVGFCLAMRRRMLEEIGLFDEVFDQGYCEETDICMRAMKAGWKVVACDNLYVYHKGGASFSDRDERYRKNIKIFMQRHGDYYRKAYTTFINRGAFTPVRNLVSAQASGRLVKSYRILRTILTDLSGLHILRAMRHFRERNTISVMHINPGGYKHFWRPGRLSVTFLFESLMDFGGVISVMRVINGLILLGHEVRVAALHGGKGQIKGLYFQPCYYGTPDDLIGTIPESEVFISTFWPTAYWLEGIKKKYPDSIYISYLQDYEILFYPGKTGQQDKVVASYKIPDRIISTSKWLADKVGNHDRPSYVIPKGIDLDLFRVLEGVERKPMSVLAMARPDARHRGYAGIIRIFSRINRSLPGVRFGIFGCDRHLARDFDVPVTEHGCIENGTPLARLYNKYSVYIDPSEFQGFGMMGLEAMSCGCACVLTNNGGITEYAVDKHNCMLSDPHAVDYMADRVVALLRNDDLRNGLVRNGLATAQKFSLGNEIKGMDACLARLTKELHPYLREVAG